MRFEFIADEHVKVKTFLKKHEVSKGLLAKIKFRGGDIRVNGHPQNATYLDLVWLQCGPVDFRSSDSHNNP